MKSCVFAARLIFNNLAIATSSSLRLVLLVFWIQGQPGPDGLQSNNEITGGRLREIGILESLREYHRLL